MTREVQICEAFDEVMRLAAALGVSQINQLDGCWEHQVDARWWVAVNGHNADTQCSDGLSVPPFSALVKFNGWPAGIIDPGGGIVAAGTVANENAFIEALRVASASGKEGGK